MVKRGLRIIGLGLLLILVGGVWAWWFYFGQPQNEGGSYIDPKASAWDDQIAAPSAVEGSIQIPGYTSAEALQQAISHAAHAAGDTKK